jgi:hypothetical protein
MLVSAEYGISLTRTWPCLYKECNRNEEVASRILRRLARRGVRRSFAPGPGERVRARPAAAVTGYRMNRMKRANYDTSSVHPRDRFTEDTSRQASKLDIQYMHRDFGCEGRWAGEFQNGIQQYGGYVW